MFEGLNALPWHEFYHAYGSAEEVPMWIRQLASAEKRVRQHALNELSGSICHQGFNCDTTVYVVPFLIELLQETSVQGKEGMLDLLARIYADDVTPIVDAQAAVSVGFPIYLPFLEHPESSVRMWAAYLLSFFTKRREPATQLTIPQRELLELFYKSSIGHWYKLSFYGLPDSTADLAA